MSTQDLCPAIETLELPPAERSEGSCSLDPRPAAPRQESLDRPSGAWSRRSVSKALLPALAFALFLWDALLLSSCYTVTHGNDFRRMYETAAAYWKGADMYGWHPWIPGRLDDSHVVDMWNMNPPHFHIPLLPLALLPWQVAFGLWWVAGFACLYASLRIIAREAGLRLTPEGRDLAIVGLLGFSATGSVLVLGQLSFLLLLPVTLMWRAARRGDWTRAGVYLGLTMSVKPFLLLLVLYFLVRRLWSATAAAMASAAAASLAGLLVFGVDNQLSWLRGLGLADSWAWYSLNGSLLGMLSRTFSETLFFEPVRTLPPGLIRGAWMALGGALALVTFAASARDTSTAGVDRAFALLLLASLLLCPLGWCYYFWLPLGPVVTLLASRWRRPAEDGAPSRAKGAWARGLFWVSLPAFFCPDIVLRVFQPSALATLTIANLCFWGLLALWISMLLFDREGASRPLATATNP